MEDFRYQPTLSPDELGRFAVHDGEAEDICHRVGTAKEAETMAILLNIRAQLSQGATL